MLKDWLLAVDWATVLIVITTVCTSASVALKAVLRLRKSPKLERLAGILDRAAAWLAKLSLNSHLPRK